MIKPKAIIESNRRYVLIPGAEDDGLLDSATLNLDFTGGQLDSRIDFQRTTVGTYYRGQFNQNSLLQSQTYTTWWSRAASTVVSSTVTAPDGTATASEILTSGTGDYIAQNQTPVLGLSYTASGYFKAGTATLVLIVLVNFPNTVVEYNLSTGVSQVTGGSADAHGMIDVGNGWWRCWVTKTYSGTGTVAVRYASGDSNAVSSYNLWGAQLTEGSLLTPYIPTTTAAITQGQIASSQPWNLLLRSQEFDVSPWGPVVTGAGVSPVVTANAAVAPDGTTTADQIDFNCGGLTASDRSIRRQLVTLTAGQTYTLSSWVRSATGSTQTVQMTAGAATFEYQVDGNWQRLSYTFTSTGGSTGVGLELRGNNTAGVTTSSIYVWGMQLNEGPAALDYRSTTSSALWLPRFENDPVTGEARGLLIEGGATNLCLQSAAVRTSPWITTNLTTAGASITAPDGTLNGVEVVPVLSTAVNGGAISQVVNVSASTAYTTSMFLKAKGTAVNPRLNIQARVGVTVLSSMVVDFSNTDGTLSSFTGGTWTATSATSTHVGNGWYRVVLTGTTPATTDNVRVFVLNKDIGDGVNGWYAWGAQVEAQAFASSYIPTTTATVARGADSAVMTGTNFSSWYNQSEGTVLCEGVSNPSPTFEDFLSIDDGATTNSLRFLRGNAAMNAAGTDAAFILRRSGTPEILWISASTLGAFASGTIGRYCVGLVANDGAGVFNNGTLRTDNAFSMPTVNRMTLHGFLAASHNIRRIAYWPTRLPNATLQSLTT